MMMKYQRGFELSSLIYWGIALAIVGMLAAKVVPSVIEYYSTVSAVKKTVENAPKGATVAQIRAAYQKFVDVERLEVQAKDLEITKDGNDIVITFEYDKKIHLFGPASLLMEYRGSSK